MGRRSTTGGVTPLGDRIQVRFSYQGQELRPTLGLKPTAANLKHAARQREQIVQEIAKGVFDLAKHFPDYKFRTQHQPDAPADARTFAKWAEVWATLSARSLEHSTLSIYKRHLAAYWTSAWGRLMPERITHEMILARLAELSEDRFDEASGKVLKGLSGKTQNNIMVPLRGVFELICKPPSTLANPTAGIENMKVQQGEPDPFTVEEVDIALAHIRKSEREGEAMADYFEFAAFAGLRPSEQIALLWSDVDLRTGVARVSHVRVMAEDKPRTKTHKVRKVELNRRAREVLERQRARTQLAGQEVFINPVTGEAYHDEQFQAREWMRALRICGIRHRPPKELRDTSVSLALSAGADPYWVAAQHGHSVTTMLKDYAAFIPKADRGRNLAAVDAAMAAPQSHKERDVG